MFDTLLNKLDYSPTVSFADEIRNYEREGKKIVKLHTGDPDFSTPELIVDSINLAAKQGFTHYSDSSGLLELRNKIAKITNHEKSIVIDNENICITIGAIHGILATLSSVLQSNDEIIVLTPIWPTHLILPKLLDVNIIEIDFLFTNHLIEDLKAKITNKTKAILFNFPNNPTGLMLDNTILKELVNLAKKNDLFIISDEVYESIYFDKIGCSLLNFWETYNKIIVVNSFSKKFAMTGYRIGYVISSREIIKQVQKFNQLSITNCPTFVQKGLSDVLDTNEINDAVEYMRNEYKTRREFIINNLRPKFINITPDGAFYFFIKLENEISAKDILNNNLLALNDGAFYGNKYVKFKRITFATSMENLISGINILNNI